MSYLVLARKFRPQTFASIVGQEHITRALANAILFNRVPHALLFTGPRGVGKTTSARVLARALNCTGRPLPVLATPSPSDGSTPEEGATSVVPKTDDPVASVEPCGECSNCKEIARSTSIAVREIDGASNNGVENVRDLIDSLRSLPPPGSRYKIYIIDEVHMLSVAAFNALLKSLEEPPPNTVFIFATTEPHKIPETVISRCQRHDFHRLPMRTISDSLKRLAAIEGVTIEDGVCEFIALRARGGMRDAQSMLDRLISFSAEALTLADAAQVFGVVDSSFYAELSEAVLAQDAGRALDLVAKAFGQSLDVRSFLAEFLAHWRNLLLTAVRKNTAEEALAEMLEISKRDVRVLVRQVDGREIFDLQRLFDVAERVVDAALTSNFPRYVVEAGVVKMSTLPDLRPLGAVLAELQATGGTHAHGARVATRASAAAPSGIAAGDAPTGNLPPQRGSAPTPKASEPEVKSASAPPPSSSFNPSWQDFVHFVRERSEVMLATFLRRVSATTFADHTLVLEGSDFDITSLRDAALMTSLKTALSAYSGDSEWSVRLVESEGKPAPAGAPEGARRRPTGPAPGSVAMLEAQLERDRQARVDQEARNDPMVKSALSVFEGSAVEKVSVFKRET